MRVLGYLSTTADYSMKDLEVKINELLIEKENIGRVLIKGDLTGKERLEVKSLEKKVIKKIEKLKFKSDKVQEKLNRQQQASKRVSKDLVGFVLVSSQEARDSILRAHLKTKKKTPWLLRVFSKREKCDLNRAPQAEKIVWENLGYTPLQRFGVDLLMLTISVVFYILFYKFTKLAVMFLLAFFIIHHKIECEWKKLLLSFVASYFILLVEIVCWLAKKVIYRISCLSLFPSKSMKVKMRVLWLGILRASAFSLVSLITEQKAEHATIIINILLKQMALLIVVRFLTLQHISRGFKMAIYGCKGKKSRIMKTQKELNTIFEKPECEVELMYSLNIYVLFLFLVFLRESPLCWYLCLLYLFVDLHANKFLFYRVYAEPKKDKEDLLR